MTTFQPHIPAIPAYASPRGWLERFAEAVKMFAAKIGIHTEFSRNRAMFRTILSDYDNMISRLCFGYAKTQEDFEDLRQDVYANIWQGIGSFRGDSELKTWIYRVALNTCVSTVRRRYKEGTKVSFTEEFSDIIDDNSERITLIAELHDSISRLPKIDKSIVLMWLDEMSYDDIANVVGLNRNTVGTRLHRA